MFGTEHDVEQVTVLLRLLPKSSGNNSFRLPGDILYWLGPGKEDMAVASQFIVAVDERSKDRC